jgi:hypothetical protein
VLVSASERSRVATSGRTRAKLHPALTGKRVYPHNCQADRQASGLLLKAELAIENRAGAL